MRSESLLAAMLLSCLPLAAQSEDPILEGTTTCSAGFRWIVAGGANRNSRGSLHYRPKGSEWIEGAPLWKVGKDEHLKPKGAEGIVVPDGAVLFAGSILFLNPGTAYEAKLVLTDPDGAPREVTLPFTTRTEPVEPANQTVFHVAPGNGGGDGSKEKPFLGFRAAQAAAKPGTNFLLHAGTYPGGITISKSGENGKPIIWRAAGDGEVIVDSKGTPEEKGRIISADKLRDVWFEGLTLRNGDKGITGNHSTAMVVRNCRISGVNYGINGTVDTDKRMTGWYLADNTIEGPSVWPRSKGIENARGIQITGSGHEICHNRIRGFADAINTFPSVHCTNIDIHHNEISECTDDGIELDESERNVRCFANRLTNVFQGISVQPVHGGPIYIVRNAMFNVVAEPFKMHNNPSGALFIHNTVVKKGMPFFVYSGVPVRSCLTRNNLFVGSAGGYAFESTAEMTNCDFDHDGFAGGPWGLFLKWNGERYADHQQVRQKAPIWRNSVALPSPDLFVDDTLPPADGKQALPPVDLRLKQGAAAMDAGTAVPGLTGPIAGRAPDLGAYENGGALPYYGPRKR